MLLPFFILGGAALLAFYKNGGSLYSKAVSAAKKQYAPDMFEAAEGFAERGDERTAAMLNMLASRIQTVKAGGSVQPQPTFDQDMTGNPAVEELGGYLHFLETRPTLLEAWAKAFDRAKLPRMRDNLTYKAYQVRSLPA